nr:unnamed protein product [Callosobruchus chinensis]
MNTTEEPNLPHDQQLLYKLLVEANKNQTLEIKAELQTLVNKAENTNTENTEDSLLTVLSKLNSVLDTNIEVSDLNDFYSLGKADNSPFVLEFISNIRKRALFKNPDKLKKLKGKGLAIANDLCPDDRSAQKVLLKHLKSARLQNLNASIKGFKLIINGEEYLAEDLMQIEKETAGEDSDSGSEVESVGGRHEKKETLRKAGQPATSSTFRQQLVQSHLTVISNQKENGEKPMYIARRIQGQIRIDVRFDVMKDYILSNDLDIFGASETWLHEGIESKVILINGYQIIRSDRDGRGGGVLFYVKNDLKFEIILTDMQSCLEQLWIKIKIGTKIYAFGVLYRPPKGNIIDCVEHLDGILSQLIFDCNGIIIIGDLNINMLSLDRGAEYLNRFLDIYSLTQVVSEPTRITPTSQSLLDLIICSIPEMVSDCKVLNLHSSFDHCLVSCSLTGAFERNSQKIIQVRNWNSFDHGIFQEMLQAIDWNYIYQIEEIDDMVQFITLNLLRIFDSCCPLRTIRVSKKHSPWITYNIREMMKTRDKAYSKFKRTRNEAHWNFYREMKNYVNRAIEVEKKAYLDFALRQKDSRNIWRRLRNLNVLNSNSSEVPCDQFDKNDINSHFVQLPVITKTLNN